MPKLRLETQTDALDLDGIASTGTGVAALVGAGGFGLPAVATQWTEGAGDGAQYRGGRVLPRDVDIPLLIQAINPAALSAYASRLAQMLAGPVTLRYINDDGTSWTLDCRRVGGGTLTLGTDTEATDWLTTVLTLRAGDPFWTSSVVTRREISAPSGRGLLLGVTPLTALHLSGSQTLGSITMENHGDADAYPLWTITGPGDALEVTSATGESFTWGGTLTAGQSLIIDTRTATVKDGTGTSRYANLGPAPRLWRIPPGTTTAQVELANTTSASRIVVEWRARRWTVI